MAVLRGEILGAAQHPTCTSAQHTIGSAHGRFLSRVTRDAGELRGRLWQPGR